MDKAIAQLGAKLRFNSESDAKGVKAANQAMRQSLPRGEYYQHVMGPKISTFSARRPSIEVSQGEHEHDDPKNEDESPSKLMARKWSTSQSDVSDSGSEDKQGSKQGTPNQKPSQFAVQNAQSNNGSQFTPDHKPRSNSISGQFHTPTIGKKKVDLYKVSIMQNISKFAGKNPESTEQSEVEKQLLEAEDKKAKGLLTKLQSYDHQALQKHQKTASEAQQHDLMPIAKLEGAVEDFDLRNLVFGKQTSINQLKKHCALVMKGLHYSINLLKAPPMQYIESRQIMLRSLKKKDAKTLVLDLDETLITSCSKRDNPDKVLKPEGDCRDHTPIMIKIRPFAKEFLKKMKQHYEIIVFTASTSPYAEAIVKELDPEKKLISYVLDRAFCLETKNGFYIKDLRILKNRDLRNMIIVDNLVHSFGFQVENGIPILEWTGDREDTELKNIQGYLEEAAQAEDIREYNREKLRLVELSQTNLGDIVLH